MTFLAAVSLAAAGCSGGSDAAPTTSASTPRRTTTTTTSTTTAAPTTTAKPTTTGPPATVPSLSTEEEAKAAYLKIIDRFYRRLQKPNSSDSSIAQNHTGPSLRQVKERVGELLRTGAVDSFTSRGLPRPHVISVRKQAETVIINNCIVDDVVVRNKTTGKVINNEVDSVLLDSELVREGGHWKLRDQVALKSWKDANGCDR